MADKVEERARSRALPPGGLPPDFHARFGDILADHSGIDVRRLRRRHQYAVRRLRDERKRRREFEAECEHLRRTIVEISVTWYSSGSSRARSTASSATATSARTMTSVADPADPPAAPADPPAEPGTSTGTPPGAPPAPQPPPDPPPDPTAPVDGDPPDVASLRREAAGYRTRLRDTETERDQLRQRLDALERGEVERLAAGAGMSTPTDLWLLVRDLDELRVDGALNPDRATERIANILSERPSWRTPRPDFGSGSRLSNGQARDPGLYDLLPQNRRR